MEFFEITDILELDFKVNKHERSFKEGLTIFDYFPEHEKLALIVNREEVDADTYEIKKNDIVFFTVTPAGKRAAFWVMIIIMLIIITVATYGQGTAPAAEGAAGSGGAGAAGAGGGGGASMAAMNSTKAAWSINSAIESGATTSSAVGSSSSMGGAMLGKVALMAGSMVLNTLLAPKMPSGDDRSPERSVYLWGDNKTQSKMMIPIPIILGKYPASGNLVASRTETKHHVSVYEPLYDIGYYEYGLTSNWLSDIEKVYFSKLDVSEMSNKDTRVFYTKGTEHQSFLYGIPNKNVENETYRFPIKTDPKKPYDNSPLEDGEALNPGQCIETVLNTTLVHPDHEYISGVFLTSEKLLVPDTNMTQGLLLGMLPNLDNIPMMKAPPYDIAILPYVGDWKPGDKVVYYSNSDDLPFRIDDEIAITIVAHDLFGHHKSVYLTYTGKILKYHRHVASTTTSYWGWEVKLLEGPKHFETIMKRSHFYIVGKEEKEADMENPVYGYELDPNTVIPDDDNWVEHRTSMYSVDKFELELFLPRGLYYNIQDKKDDTDLHHTFVTFEYELYYGQYGSFTRAIRLSPQGHRLFINDPEIDILHPDHQPVMGIYICTKQPCVYTVSSHDIIKHKWSTEISGYDKLQLIDNKLPDGNYLIRIRVQNLGNSRYRHTDGTFKSYEIMLEPKRQSVWSGAVQHNEIQADTVILYRLKEYNYTDNINYPFTSILGFSYTASSTTNNSLPQILALCKNYILVWDETPGTEEKLDTNYTYQFSQNPGYICLDLLFNSYYGAALGGYGSVSPQSSPDFSRCLEQFKRYVDIKAFCDFAKYCDEPVSIDGMIEYTSDPNNPEYTYDATDGKWKPKRFVCNGLLDASYTIVDWLSKILGSYDAAITFKGSQISIIFEREFSTFIPDQIFTSSNIIKDSFNQAFLNPELLASTLETTFMDEKNLYEKTPVVYMPFDGTGIDPNKKGNINLYGFTNLNRVLSRLHSILRKTNYLTQVVEFSTSTQGFTRRVGDKIGVTHEYIEWGVLKKNQEIIQAGGRVTKVNHSTFEIFLDRLIYIEDESVDLIDKYIYIRSLKDDNMHFQAKITNYRVEFGKTVVTIYQISDPDDLAIWNMLEKYDIYLIGEYEDIYKESIITDISFQSDNVVKIKATVFDEAIYEKGTIITDILGSVFTPDECGIKKCTIVHNEVNNTNELNWEAPLLLSAEKVTNRLNLKITLVTYQVYRKLMSPTIIYDPDHEKVDFTPWENIGETTETSFVDELVSEKGVTYAYKVSTVVKINNYLARIPLSWSDMCRKPIYHQQDYLEKVVPINYGFEKSKNELSETSYDLTIVCEDLKEQKDWNNMILVWLKISDSPDIFWLGNQNIRLIKDAAPGDRFIYVNTIIGLPRNENDTSKVFGLVVLDDREIVFVKNSTQLANSWELELAYYDEIDQDGVRLHNQFIYRRYYLSTPVLNKSKVTNAHLGFYPILCFACAEDNNIKSGPTTNIITTDSLYYYDYDKGTTIEGANIVKKINYLDKETAPLLANLGSIGKMLRITTGTDNLITGLGAEGAGLTSENNIFMSLFKKSSSTILDFDINYAWQTADEKTHSILVAALYPCPEITWLGVVGRKETNNINFTFKNIEIPTGSHVWAALTHIYTIGEETPDPYGYTSFPVVIDI